MSELRDRIDRQINQNRLEALEARYGHLLKVNEEMAETIVMLQDAPQRLSVSELQRTIDLQGEKIGELTKQLSQADENVTALTRSRTRAYKKLIDIRGILN
jgi:uncharacterized coiled-coil protein SlyX